ncbi:MAG: hypothetical protein KGI69_01320 [Patescibacteria group bacterium]|nr:hypothetical protein [Patescibacteria group bacterium]
MKPSISEIAIALVLIALAALLVDPYWMPMGMLYTLLVCFALVFGGFAAFIWRERGGDERDALIRYVAARSAYLSSVLIMAVGIISQTAAHHTVDRWLMASFIVAILAKAVGYAYGSSRY